MDLHCRWSRREFMRRGATAAGLAAAKLTGPAPGVLGSNERIRVGIIGPGDRGTALLRQFVRESARYNARIAAVCDLWNLRREQARRWVREHTGRSPAVFRNTQELYSRNSVDAVIIATPDFSHAILCAEAARAGVDVYVERPLAHVIEEARAIRQACGETDRVVQVGAGGRSSGNQISAAGYIASGRLGRALTAELGRHVNQPRCWRRDSLVRLLRERDTDWPRYQLNRPPRPFDARRYLEFRLFWPYSSGLPDQWLSHDIDTVAHITGELYPSSCVAGGSVCQWHDGRENADAFTAVFKYPSGFEVRYSARQTDGHGGSFQRFFLERGVLDLQAETVSPEVRCGAAARSSEFLPSRKLPEVREVSPMANWLDCIRSRRKPNADMSSGYAHAVAVSMAVKAMHTGRRISFDPNKHELSVT